VVVVGHVMVFFVSEYMNYEEVLEVVVVAAFFVFEYMNYVAVSVVVVVDYMATVTLTFVSE
jgi:hypothetical protein